MVKKLTVLSKVGYGAFSTTYLCRNKHGEEMVLKVNDIEYQSFNREIDCLRHTSSSFLCGIVDVIYGPLDVVIQNYEKFPLATLNETSILFKKAKGDMEQYRVADKIDHGLIKTFAFQTLIGLDHIHKVGIIHRDLKLDNVLVYERKTEDDTKEYMTKIADFGNAVFHSNNDLLIRPPTAFYIMPPENCQRLVYDTKIDIWCFGSMLYECLFNRTFVRVNEDCPTNENVMLFTILSRYSDKKNKKFDQYCRSRNSASINTFVERNNSNWFDNPKSLFKKQNLIDDFKVFKKLLEVIKKCLKLNPTKRYSAEQLLSLPYFEQCSEAIERNVSTNSEVQKEILRCRNENKDSSTCVFSEMICNYGFFPPVTINLYRQQIAQTLYDKLLKIDLLKIRPRILYHAYEMFCRYYSFGLETKHGTKCYKTVFISTIFLSCSLFTDSSKIVGQCCQIVFPENREKKVNAVKRLSKKIVVDFNHILYSYTLFEEISLRRKVDRMSQVHNEFDRMFHSSLKKLMLLETKVPLTIPELYQRIECQ